MSNDRHWALSRRASLKLGAAMTLCSARPGWALLTPSSVQAFAPAGRQQPFSLGWRFHKGDHQAFASPAFDDRDWRSVDLPHDWSIEDLVPVTEPSANATIRAVDTDPIWASPKDAPKIIGPFASQPPLLGASSPSAGGHATGHTVGGMGWYRKRFRLPPMPADGHVELIFDGVYRDAEIYLNGVQIGMHPSGYTPFGVDLTPHLDPAGDNVIAVRVSNLGENSRWYAGSGIYRNVSLNATRTLRFARWGASITTPSVSAQSSSVRISATVEGASPTALLKVAIKDAAGRVVAQQQAIADAASVIVLEIDRPKLWSPEMPALYTAECSLLKDGETHDSLSVSFGIRRVEIDARQGLRINGKPYKLRGGCVHHDNGLLGSAAFGRAEERKVELMKARGFNAIRTSHNPPSSAFLDACDRLGMLVMEEAFDCWNVSKNPDDYHLFFQDQWRDDLAAMVHRDGNHPSVILWSIGNEVPETIAPEGVATAKLLAEEVRRLDPTRPITQAINGPNGAAVVREDGRPDQAATRYLDVAGYNYKLRTYEADHARFGERVIVGTESFPKDVDAIWRLTDRSPYLIGDFVWTAIDYIGEAGIGRSELGYPDPVKTAYPWFGAFCGDIDLIGQQKPQSLLRGVVWGLSPVEMAVQRPLPEGAKERLSFWGWRDELQSWTWPGAEGKPLNVSIYTRGDRVDLLLNDRVVGSQELTDKSGSMVQIDVPYAPGKLVARAFADGRRIGERLLETVGPSFALRLKPDRTRLHADRGDLVYATVEVVDKAGRLVPDAVHVLRTSLSGPVELVGFGNANPRGVASFQQPTAKSWHGRALAIARPTGEPGRAMLRVESVGLRPAFASIDIGS